MRAFAAKSDAASFGSLKRRHPSAVSNTSAF
jgi:hypothetical protein